MNGIVLRYDTAAILGTTAIVHKVQNLFIIAKIGIFLENDADKAFFITLIFLKMIEKMPRPLDKGVFEVIYLHRQTSHKRLL